MKARRNNLQKEDDWGECLILDPEERQIEQLVRVINSAFYALAETSSFSMLPG